MAFRTAETGFDPQRIDDRYSVGHLREHLRAAAHATTTSRAR